MNYTQLILKTIRVYGNRCMGCLSKQKDIMISIQSNDSEDITDLFLTTTQAENLIINLEKILKDNNQ